MASTSDVNGDGVLDAGDRIAYVFTVANTGSIDLHSVHITDTLLSRLHVGVTCPASTLAATQAMTCTSSSLTVTAFQAKAGSVTNYSTAQAVSSAGARVSSNVASTRQNLSTAPTGTSHEGGMAKASGSRAPRLVSRLALTQYIDSTADRNSNGYLDATDSLIYGFTVTNSGGRRISGITIVDKKLTGLGLSVTCPTTVLDPGSSMKCLSAREYLTAYLGSHGVGVNIAYAQGTNPAGRTVRSNSTYTKQGRKITDLQKSSLAYTGPGSDAGVGWALLLVCAGLGLCVASRFKPIPAGLHATRRAAAH